MKKNFQVGTTKDIWIVDTQAQNLSFKITRQMISYLANHTKAMRIPDLYRSMFHGT